MPSLFACFSYTSVAICRPCFVFLPFIPFTLLTFQTCFLHLLVFSSSLAFENCFFSCFVAITLYFLSMFLFYFAIAFFPYFVNLHCF